MDFNSRFPLKLSAVYKVTPHGLSLYTQEYVIKFLDEAKEQIKDEIAKKKETKDIEAESDIDKSKFPKKSKINTEVEEKIGSIQA